MHVFSHCVLCIECHNSKYLKDYRMSCWGEGGEKKGKKAKLLTLANSNYYLLKASSFFGVLHYHGIA